MATNRHNSSETVRIQISLDANSAGLLELIATYGQKGKNKAEVATRILQDWLLENGEILINRQESSSQLLNQKNNRAER